MSLSHIKIKQNKTEKKKSKSHNEIIFWRHSQKRKENISEETNTDRTQRFLRHRAPKFVELKKKNILRTQIVSENYWCFWNTVFTAMALNLRQKQTGTLSLSLWIFFLLALDFFFFFSKSEKLNWNSNN